MTRSVRKCYKITVSSKFPDGSLASVSSETDIEEEGRDPKELFAEVYKSTIEDLRATAKSDKIVAYILKTVNRVVNQE